MYIAGFATEEECREMEARGMEVEDAADFKLTTAKDDPAYLMTAPTGQGTRAVVVFMDCALFDLVEELDPAEGSAYPQLSEDEVAIRIALLKGALRAGVLDDELSMRLETELVWWRSKSREEAGKSSELTADEVEGRVRALREAGDMLLTEAANGFFSLCTHVRADGSSAKIGTSNGESRCCACGNMFD